jgi:hypothetical protein
LDINKDVDPAKKKKNEQWLDFVLVCEKIEKRKLPQDQQIALFVEIGDR